MSAPAPEPKKTPSTPPAKPSPAAAPVPRRHTDAHVPIKPPKAGVPIPKSPAGSRPSTGLTQLTSAVKGNQSGLVPKAASGLQPRVSGIIPKARTNVLPAAKTSAPGPATSGFLPAAKEGLSKAAKSTHDPRANTGFVPAIKHAPASEKRKETVSSLSRAIQLNCRSCGKSILDAGPNSPVEKSGGGLICGDCVTQRRQREASRGRLIRALAGASVAALIAFSILLPGQTALAATIGGGVCALTGLLAHDTRRIWRFAMLGIGLCVIGGGVFGMVRVQENLQREAARAAVKDESAAIAAMLEKNQFAEAQGRFRTFSAAAAGGAYAADNAAAQSALTELQQRMNAWLEKRFGAASEEERTLALALLARYPDSSSKGIRVQGVSLKEKETIATIRVQSSSDAAAPAEARSVLLFLFETYPQLQKIRLETGSAVYENTRDLVSQLRYGGLPQKVSTP
ncbi:MAG TPA: hypothetical protein VEJ63_07130 [Planctomycetota bacterium]|nr:hypothetical protein [Planctomycetota bacterium]